MAEYVRRRRPPASHPYWARLHDRAHPPAVVAPIVIPAGLGLALGLYGGLRAPFSTTDAVKLAATVPPLGAFVPAGAPLFRVHGDPEGLAVEAVVKLIQLGMERTLDQDVAFGLRMLVDMAERSLADSPFLDPTTAVQAIDRLHDCLRQIAERELPVVDQHQCVAHVVGVAHAARPLHHQVVRQHEADPQGLDDLVVIFHWSKLG